MPCLVTGSRRTDLILFGLLAALILGSVWRVRVYYEVPAWAIERLAPRSGEGAPRTDP